MSKRTTPFSAWLAPALTALALVWPMASLAQGVDPDALKLLRKSTDYLASAKQFSVQTDTALGAVTSTGQKLQFGHSVTMTVQRPSKLRAERVGELVGQVFYYDGKSLSVSVPNGSYHATVSAPPTIDAMLDFARDKLDIVAPAADLVYSNAYERLTEGLTSAFVVGEAMVGGARCDHLAFRNAEVDWQIWIQRGDKPLPRKFVVTSKNMPQSPEFVVILSKWDAAPKITDAMFRYAPPKGSRPIEFLPAPGAAKK